MILGIILIAINNVMIYKHPLLFTVYNYTV